VPHQVLIRSIAAFFWLRSRGQKFPSGVQGHSPGGSLGEKPPAAKFKL